MKNLYKIGDELYIISSSEKIKENTQSFKEGLNGDWFYNTIYNFIARTGDITSYDFKIILTTDKLLIKDGVQAIPDNFLEWFVKNPSCEYVEIKKDSYNLSPMEKMLEKEYVPKSTFDTYKIIIPKKEPKDVVLGYKTSLDAQMLDKIGLKEPKQIKCYCGHTTYCDCDSLEPEQETLDYLQVCEDCGSEEVARCKWVNVNTEEIYSADSGNNLEWCFNCKNETNIIDK
jgi:hypothetical protein